MFAAKYRRELRKRLEEDLGEETPDITEEEIEKGVIAAACSEIPYDPLTGSMDMARKKVTRIKENSYVHLPGPLSSMEEAKLAIRLDQYRKEFKEHVEKECKGARGQFDARTKEGTKAAAGEGQEERTDSFPD